MLHYLHQTLGQQQETSYYLSWQVSCQIFSHFVQGYFIDTTDNLLMTSPNGNIFRVIGLLLWGIHRWPVDSLHKVNWRGALMFFYLCLNKRLGKQSKRRWFETPLRSLWRHCNVARDVSIKDINTQARHAQRKGESRIYSASHILRPEFTS